MSSFKSRILQLLFLLTVLLPVMGTVGRDSAPTAEAQGGRRLYMPLVSTIPGRISIFGGEINTDNMLTTQAPALAGDAGLSLIRFNRLDWSAIEPTKGVRNWDGMSYLPGTERIDLDASLSELSSEGLNPLLVVFGTPGWAQKYPGVFCGPIKESELTAFGDFMYDLVNRYSRPPFNVMYYELFNEPDVAWNIIPPDSDFGCWGDGNDAYYGGGYYGQMLNVVYPRIKQANPQAQVLIGGLLLDCDNTYTYNPPRDCLPSKFFEGMLRAGAGNSFDLANYHGYPLRYNGRFDWDLEYPTWAHRGGVVLGKLDFLRDTMAQYGVNRPVILTEGGLLCPNTNGCAATAGPLQQDQANYAVRLYTRAIANNLVGALWYTFDGPGWRDGGLLDANQNPRPAYNTVRFLSGTLTNATRVQSIRDGDLEGYIFQSSESRFAFYWTNRNEQVTVPFPAGAQLYNKFGEIIPSPTNGQLVVGFEPIMIKTPR